MVSIGISHHVVSGCGFTQHKPTLSLMALAYPPGDTHSKSGTNYQQEYTSKKSVHTMQGEK